MAPIILGNASSIGNVSNIIVPYKDQYRISTGGVGGVAIGNTVNSSVFSTGTVIIAGTNLTINTSAVGAHQYLNLSIADPAAAANYVQGGDYISLSTGGVGTTISVTGLQPAGAYITTAALSDHNHGGNAFATGNIGGTIGTYTTSSATGSFYGWSLSIPDFLVTAAESNHTHSIYAGIGTSTGTTTGTDAKLTVNTAGISLRTPRYLTTAANISHTHGTPVGYNITIGSSSNNLVLSVGNYLTTAALSNHSHSEYLTTMNGGNNLTLAGNTLGTLTEMNSGTVTIAGGNNITLSQNGNAFTIIGAASGTNAGIVLSADGSNTSGTLGIISSGTLNLQGGNNITLSQSSNTIHIIGGAGNVGTGFTSSSITGNNIAGTLSTNGLSLLVPQYMLSLASANFAGTGSSIIGGSMTYNTEGLTLNIPSASISASNSIYAGNNISLSTAGVATTVSVYGLLGTEAAGSFVQTAFSTLLQHVSDNSLSLATSQSSLFQLTAHNSNSLGTTYTSHTHSNLYIALSESSLYRTSVLSNTFLTTGYRSHTHSNLYLPVSASTAYQTSILDNTFALTNHSHSQYLTTAMLSNYTSAFEYTSHTSAITSNAIHSSQTGSVIFASSLNSNVTWTSTYSGNSTYLGASVNTVGGAALRGSGTYTQNSGTIQFANSNGITFGLTNNQMTASVSNNAGSLYFADSNGVTFGINSNTNSQSTVTASVNMNVGLGTSTFSKFEHPYVEEVNEMFNNAPYGNGFPQGALLIKSVECPYYVNGSAMRILVKPVLNTFSSNISASGAITFNFGIWKKSLSSLTLLSSNSRSYSFYWLNNSSSSYNNAYLIDNPRELSMPININITPGYYYFGFNILTATSYSGFSLCPYGNTAFPALGVNYYKPFNESGPYKFVDNLQGSYTATTNGIPSNVASSQIKNWISTETPPSSGYVLWNQIYNNE